MPNVLSQFKTPEEQIQWLQEHIDSTISAPQWGAWLSTGQGGGAGQLDPKCPDDNPFRSSKEGAGAACVEKPDNCPEGMTAFGQNKCLSSSDPRVLGGGGAPGAGGPGQGQPEGLGDLIGSSIWNRVSDQFNFGTPEAGSKQGSFKLTGDKRGPQGEATLLGQGGGLLWGAVPDAWKKLRALPPPA